MPLMTDGTSIDGVTNPVINRTAGNKNALENVDFTTYITLLTKQLQNQDPLKPMDSQQFTSEIATYAQLEQQIKGNDLLEKMQANQDYGMQALAASYLGKEVLSDGNVVEFDGTNYVDFGYVVDKNAANVTLEIINNETGAVVKTSKVDGGEGLHAVTWDGKLENGEKAPEGDYTLKVTARDADGNTIPARPVTYVKAQEMVTENGEIHIKLANGMVVAFDDILSVRNTPEPRSPAPEEDPEEETPAA